MTDLHTATNQRQQTAIHVTTTLADCDITGQYVGKRLPDPIAISKAPLYQWSQGRDGVLRHCTLSLAAHKEGAHVSPCFVINMEPGSLPGLPYRGLRQEIFSIGDGLMRVVRGAYFEGEQFDRFPSRTSSVLFNWDERTNKTSGQSWENYRIPQEHLMSWSAEASGSRQAMHHVIFPVVHEANARSVWFLHRRYFIDTDDYLCPCSEEMFNQVEAHALIESALVSGSKNTLSSVYRSLRDELEKAQS